MNTSVALERQNLASVALSAQTGQWRASRSACFTSREIYGIPVDKHKVDPSRHEASLRVQNLFLCREYNSDILVVVFLMALY